MVLTAGFVLQVYYKQRDYWPFVWCVRYISPHLALHVEQVGTLPAMCSVVFKHFNVDSLFLSLSILFIPFSFISHVTMGARLT